MTTLPIAVLLFSTVSLFAQAPSPAPAPISTPVTVPKKGDEKPIVTKHSMQLGGKTLSYTVTTGL